MIPFFKDNKLLLATSNKGKLREFQALFEGFNLNIILSSDEILKGVIENGSSFAENALIKAKNAFDKTGLAVIADDSGLEVDELKGFPGIYSARFAEDCGGFENAMAKIVKLIKESQNPLNIKARFKAVIAFITSDGKEMLFEGVSCGSLAYPSRGKMGFGYDPFFIPEGENKTFAQMTLDEKQKYSHRAIAAKKFLNFCLNNS